MLLGRGRDAVRPGSSRAADGDVVMLTATGVVDNVMADYLEDGVRQRGRARARRR